MASLRVVISVVALCFVGAVLAKPSTLVVNQEDNDVNPDKVKVGGVAVAVDVGAGPMVAVGVAANHPSPVKPVVVVNKPVNPNLYNDIFNIPTSILSAVNRLLTNGAASLGFGGGGAVHASGTKVTSGATATSGTQDLAARIGTDGDKPEAVGGAATVAVAVNKPAASGHGNNFFDNIFNIPISALNAVNQLLNNNRKVATGGN